MNLYYLIAGILSILLGAIHTIVGEKLIFQSKKEEGQFIPSREGGEWKEDHVRIIWASWHMATAFAWALAAIILFIAFNVQELPPEWVTILIISASLSMLTGSVLVLLGTKGKHPGWIVLLLIGLLLLIGYFLP
ncbi:MAG: hypothetical protein AAGC85_21710 [Bacteroidota bacterium]